MKVIKVLSKGSYHDVIVDDDFDERRKLWLKGGYVQITHEKRDQSLHRVLLNVPVHSPQTVDHINRNKLDNRRGNLRIATRQQQAINKVKKGWSLSKRYGTYQARLRINGKLIHIGSFKTPEEANEAYKKAHVKYFGEYSPYYKEDN